MSELKAVHAFDVYEAYTKTGDDDAAQVYLKSEADKVIEEKDKEIARLDDLAHAHNIELLCKENQIAELKQQIEVLQKEKKIIQDLYIGELDDCRIWALRAIHNKYKRCLDIAEWCSYKSEVFDQYSRHTDYVPNIEKYRRKRDHYADRSNKLLILAEKFKEKN